MGLASVRILLPSPINAGLVIEADFIIVEEALVESFHRALSTSE